MQPIGISLIEGISVEMGDDSVSSRGRGDEMLMMGSRWLAPQEVEGCLLEPAAVVGIPDADGLVKPITHVVLKEERNYPSG